MLARRLFSDSALYTLTGIAARGALFLLVPLYTRALPPSAYGRLDMLLVLGQLVNLVVALEVSQAVPRFWSAAPGDAARRGYASSGLWFTVAMHTAFALVAWVVADPMGRALVGGADGGTLLRAALPSYWAQGIAYLLCAQLRWELRPVRYAVATLLTTLVTLGAALALVLGAAWGVRGILFAQAAGYAVGAVIAATGTRRTFAARLDLDRLRELLRFSLPLVPSSIAVFVTLYIDRFVISRVAGLAAVGEFTVGYRVASLIALVTVGVQSAVTPLVYAHQHDAATPRELARVFRYFAALALALWLTIALLAPELVALLSPPEYAAATAVVPPLAAALIVAGLYIFAPGPFLAGRTGAIAALNGLGAALAFGLNLALVPLLGIAGAGLANLVAATAVFAGSMRLSQRLFPVPHPWRRHALALGAVVAAFALAPAVAPGGPAGLAVRLLALAAGASAAATALLLPAERRALAARLVRRAAPAAATTGAAPVSGAAPAIVPDPAPDVGASPGVP